MLPQIDEAASITPQPIDYLTGPQLQEIWLRENWIMKALNFPPISQVPYDIHGCQKLLGEKSKDRYQVFAKAMSTAIYKVMAHFKSQHTENLMQIISPDQSAQLIGSIELSHTKSNQLAILIHVQQIISYFASQDVALPADWQKLTADDFKNLEQIADKIVKLEPSYALNKMKLLQNNRKKACLSFLENYLLPQAESAFNTEQRNYQKAHQLAMEVLTGRSQAEERLKQTKRLERKIIKEKRQLKQLQRTYERALQEKARHINQEIIKDKHQLKNQQQALTTAEKQLRVEQKKLKNLKKAFKKEQQKLAEVRKTNGSALAAFNERVKQAQMQLATCYQALKHGLPDIEQTDDAFILTSLPVSQMPLYQAAQTIVDGPAVTLDERYPLLAESTPWQDDLHRLLYQNILKGYHDIYSSWLSRHLGFLGPWCLGTTERTIITNRPSYDKIYRLLNLLYHESSSIKDLAEYLLINKLLMEVAEPFLNFYEMDELVPAASYQSMEVECISDTAAATTTLEAASAEGTKRRQLTLSHHAVERSTLLKQNLQLLLQYHGEHINPLAEASSSIKNLQAELKEKNEIIDEKEEVIQGQEEIIKGQKESIKELTEQLQKMQAKVAKQAHSPARTSKGKTASSIGRFFNEAPSPQEKRPPSPDSGPQAF